MFSGGLIHSFEPVFEATEEFMYQVKLNYCIYCHEAKYQGTNVAPL